MQPDKFTTGSVEKAPVPLPMVGGVTANAGESKAMAAVARTPDVNKTAVKICESHTLVDACRDSCVHGLPLAL